MFDNRRPMPKRLALLLACVFAATIGFGVTLPVLPFYVERMALARDRESEAVFMQVGLITGAFPFVQVAFAPWWGWVSDRVGRRPALVLGLAGNAVSQMFFGFASNLPLLYAARIVGGAFSAAILPAATAYVTDVTDHQQRGRGMAWIGSAVALGLVLGPTLGIVLSRHPWAPHLRLGTMVLNDFTIPFVAAGLIVLLTAAAAARWLPETRVTRGGFSDRAAPRGWPEDAVSSGPLVRLLGYSFLAQFALALFEGTFALHAQRNMGFGPTELGVVFATCGVVMAAAQVTVIAWLFSGTRQSTWIQIGFLLMAAGLSLLMMRQTFALILADVAIVALGGAMLAPSLAALVSERAGDRAGRLLGFQAAANNLGQAAGPIIGVGLLIWNVHAPYVIAVLLLAIATLSVSVGRTVDRDLDR